MAWTAISEEEAKQHPLYGISGWLLLFAVLLFLSILVSWGHTNNVARDYGYTLSEFFSVSHPIVTYTKVAVFVHTGFSGVILFCLFAQYQGFRLLSSWLLALSVPVVFFLGREALVLPGMGAVAAQATISWLFWGTVWVAYLNRSKRVRVTFEHMVQGPLPAAPASSGSMDATPARQQNRRIEPTSAPLAPAQGQSTSSAAAPSTAPSSEPSMAPASASAVQRAAALAPPADAMATAYSPNFELQDVEQEPPEGFAPTRKVPPRTQADQAQPVVAAVTAGAALSTASEFEDDEMLWAQAHQEFESPKRREGLWARSFAKANGNEAQAKALYLEARVKELAHALRQKVEAMTGEQRDAELAPKGSCPNCGRVQLLTSKDCSACGAIFGAGSAWQLSPLPR